MVARPSESWGREEGPSGYTGGGYTGGGYTGGGYTDEGYTGGYKRKTKKKTNLFCWDKIPGKDDARFIKFLKQNFDIDWVENAKIEKIDKRKTIRVSDEKNCILLRLNDKKNKVTLEISDGRTDEYIVRIENGKINIYNKTRKKDKRKQEE